MGLLKLNSFKAVSKLIWFGNGEAKPVQIQMYYADKAIGAPIQIDYLGKVDAAS